MKLFELSPRLYEEENANNGSEGSIEEQHSEENSEASSETIEEVTGQTEEEELDEASIRQAKSLYKLLKDPNSGRETLRILAQRAGILDQPLETKSDVREAKKDLRALVKEKLGDEYSFLAEKLGNVLEAVLEEERQTQNVSVQKLEAENTTREVQGVLDKLARETKGESRKSENRIIELMDKFTIGRNTSIEDYLRGLYAQATASRQSATIKGQMADKIKRNANDVGSRLQSVSGTGKGTTEVSGKKMSLNESVNFALEQLNKK